MIIYPRKFIREYQVTSLLRPRISHYLLALILVAMMPIRNAFSSETLVVTKAARSTNPSLRIGTFEAKSKVKEALIDALTYSDWFAMDQSDETDYLLAGAYIENSSDNIIRIQIVDQNREPVTKFQLKASKSVAIKTFIYSAVDEIITQVFKVPGFCSSKLAFVKEIDGVKEIWISDFNGDNPEQFTFNNSLSVEPNWSKDGKFLVYTFYPRSCRQYIVSAAQISNGCVSLIA